MPPSPQPSARYQKETKNNTPLALAVKKLKTNRKRFIIFAKKPGTFVTPASPPLSPNTNSPPLLQTILTNKDSHIYLHHQIEWIQPPPAAKIPFLENSLLAKIRKITAYALVTLGFLMTLAATGSLSCQALGLQVGMLPIGFGDLFMPGLIAILTGFHLPKGEAKNQVRFRIPTAIPGLTFHVL